MHRRRNFFIRLNGLKMTELRVVQNDQYDGEGVLVRTTYTLEKKVPQFWLRWRWKWVRVRGLVRDIESYWRDLYWNNIRDAIAAGERIKRGVPRNEMVETVVKEL